MHSAKYIKWQLSNYTGDTFSKRKQHASQNKPKILICIIDQAPVPVLGGDVTSETQPNKVRKVKQENAAR